jgi:hypothetical protein
VTVPGCTPPVAGYSNRARDDLPNITVPAASLRYEGESMYALAQAAKAAGKSKPTIARAIKRAGFPPAAPRTVVTRLIPAS